MRIERTGEVERITPRFQRFLKERLGAVSLDDEGDKFTRPDFECLDGRLVVELKTLEEAPEGRMENALAPLKEREEWPQFYGQMGSEHILKRFPDRKELERLLLSRLGRAIVNHVKKAQTQLSEHAVRSAGREAGPATNLLVLINEDHPEYSPEAVNFIVHRELTREREAGSSKYQDLHAVVYLTERHAAAVDGQLTLPICVIEGPAFSATSQHSAVVGAMLEGWAEFGQSPIIGRGEHISPKLFDAVEHVPDKMSNSDAWRLDYRRNPHMRLLSNKELRLRFHQSVLSSMFAFGRHELPKPSQREMIELMKISTEIQEECSRRGLAMDYLNFNPQRIEQALRKSRMPLAQKEWLRKTVRKPNPHQLPPRDPDRGQAE